MHFVCNFVGIEIAPSLSCEVTLPDLIPAWTWWILSAMISVVCCNEVQA